MDALTCCATAAVGVIEIKATSEAPASSTGIEQAIVAPDGAHAPPATVPERAVTAFVKATFTRTPVA